MRRSRGKGRKIFKEMKAENMTNLIKHANLKSIIIFKKATNRIKSKRLTPRNTISKQLTNNLENSKINTLI